MTARVAASRATLFRASGRFGNHEAFSFRCSPHFSCFTACCRDVNIFLSPLDVLRLRGVLGLSSGEFLHEFAVVVSNSPSPFPLLFLKMEEDRQLRCPFVSPSGCSVYSARPWACRMYPLVPANDEDGAPEFQILQDPACQGHGAGRPRNATDWIQNQGAEQDDELSRNFVRMTAHPFFRRGGRLDPIQSQIYLTALYDLDRLRSLQGEFRVEDGIGPTGKGNTTGSTLDAALLRMGMTWLENVLDDLALQGDQKPPSASMKGDLQT